MKHGERMGHRPFARTRDAPGTGASASVTSLFSAISVRIPPVQPPGPRGHDLRRRPRPPPPA
jgi:hypothetical protein